MGKSGLTDRTVSTLRRCLHAVFGKTQAVQEPVGLNRTARLAGRTVPRQVKTLDRPRPRFQLLAGIAQEGRDVDRIGDEPGNYPVHTRRARPVEFCERYDGNCFDPDYDWPLLEHFAPAVEEVRISASRSTPSR